MKLLAIPFLLATLFGHAQIDTLIFQDEEWNKSDSTLFRDTIQEKRKWCHSPAIAMGHQHTYEAKIYRKRGKHYDLIHSVPREFNGFQRRPQYRYVFDSLYSFTKRCIKSNKAVLILSEKQLSYYQKTNTIDSLERVQVISDFALSPNTESNYVREVKVVMQYGDLDELVLAMTLSHIKNFNYLNALNPILNYRVFWYSGRRYYVIYGQKKALSSE